MAPTLNAAQDGLSTLRIEAGTVIRFASNVSNIWSMNLGVSSGATPAELYPVRVIAVGTAEAPIVLTTATEPAVAGAWGGVEWHAGPPLGNMFSNVRIENAGGDTGNGGFGCGPGDYDAALLFLNWEPREAFVVDCTFANSAGGGIVSGWRSALASPNFRVVNTFTNIGNGCNVSRNAAANGACPANGPTCC